MLDKLTPQPAVPAGSSTDKEVAAFDVSDRSVSDLSSEIRKLRADLRQEFRDEIRSLRNSFAFHQGSQFSCSCHQPPRREFGHRSQPPRRDFNPRSQPLSVDNRPRNLAPRQQQFPTRDGRTRDGRPTCYRCGTVGHLAASCHVRLTPRASGQPSPTRIAMLTPVPYPEVPIISGNTAEFIMPDSTTIDDDFQEEDTIDIREYEETPLVVPLVEVSSLETPTERPQEIICYEPREVCEEPIEVSCVEARSCEIPTVPMDLVDAPISEPVLIAGDGTYSLPHDLSVQGEAAGMGVHFLIDTGAAITVVRTEFLQKSPLGYTFPLKTGELQAVKTVSGEQVPVQGKISLPLTIQDTQYNCEAYVIDNLGYDFFWVETF